MNIQTFKLSDDARLVIQLVVIIGALLMFGIFYLIMDKFLAATDCYKTIQKEYAKILSNYSCFPNNNKGCIMGGFYYPDCEDFDYLNSNDFKNKSEMIGNVYN